MCALCCTKRCLFFMLIGHQFFLALMHNCRSAAFSIFFDLLLLFKCQNKIIFFHKSDKLWCFLVPSSFAGIFLFTSPLYGFFEVALASQSFISHMIKSCQSCDLLSVVLCVVTFFFFSVSTRKPQTCNSVIFVIPIAPWLELKLSYPIGLASSIQFQSHDTCVLLCRGTCTLRFLRRFLIRAFTWPRSGSIWSLNFQVSLAFFIRVLQTSNYFGSHCWQKGYRH